MWYLTVKSLLSGVMIMAVSEMARRSPALGGLIASLPLVSVLAMLWLWHESGDPERIAQHAAATFWFVLPSLPMFLLLPLLLRAGVGFHLSLALACGITIVLYIGMARLLTRLGITL